MAANPQIEFPFGGPLHARVGVLFKHASSVDDSRILATTRPEGSGGVTLGGGEVVLAMDTRAGSFPSTRGLFLQVTGRHTPEIFRHPPAVSKLRREASAS